MNKAESEAVIFRQTGDVTIAALQTTEITSKASDMIQVRLREMQNRGPAVKLVLDLSKLDFLGSVGLSVLVLLLQRVRKGEGRLALAGLTGLCRDVMRVTGLERAFQICDDVPAALKVLAKA